MSEIILDQERQHKAKEYSRISKRLMLLDLGVGLVYLVAWIVFGWTGLVKARLIAVSANPWWLVAGYGAIIGGIYYLLDLPLGFYSGFVLPHRYDLSTETLKGWVVDQVKGVLLGGILSGLLLEAIYALLRWAPETWWLWAGGLLLVITVLLANLAPVILMPIFNKFVPLDEEYAELAQRLMDLARKAGTKVQGVFAFDMSRRSKAANAALTGLGNTRRIILGDTLLKEFTADEVETVIAHELGHQVNKDIPWLILVQSILTLGGLYLAAIGLRWGATQLGFSGPADIAALPLFMLVMGAYGLVTMPLTNGFSRWRERMADSYAVQITGKPIAMASALTRLANQNLSDANPEAWEEFLLYSHPALSKRIAAAKQSTNPAENNRSER